MGLLAREDPQNVRGGTRHCRLWINRAKAGEREQPITPSLRDALQRQQAMEADPEG